MEIIIENKTIISTDFSDTEIAWKMEDALLVLEYLKSKNRVVLGGDILTEKLEHNYDSWYYNVKHDHNSQFNVEYSNKCAIDYISNYINANGKGFYVVFVTE